jgi:uroporphyrinogen decarboxylase
MTSKERILALVGGDAVDRPPFMPAIYDLKATLAEVPAHEFGRTVEEVELALQREVELLSAEALTVGYDIYNVEAEAVGCVLNRNPDHGIPEIAAPVLEELAGIADLPAVSVPAGRMPVFVEAAKKAQERYGEEILVRGAVSGPFSMAAGVYGREKLLMDLVVNRDGVRSLLAYCTDVILTYVRAFVDAGVGIVVFDSFISPPMISPELYESVILAFHTQLFTAMREMGVAHRPLIAGGNSPILLPWLVRTGANQFLLDFSLAAPAMRTSLERFPFTFRVNMDPALIAESDEKKVEARTHEVLNNLAEYRNIILGTGILPANTPLENIRAVRQALVARYSGRRLL